MPGVAAADDDGAFVLALGRDSSGKLRGVDEAGAGEGGEAFEIGREVGLSTMSGGLDDVLLRLVMDIGCRRNLTFGWNTRVSFLPSQRRSRVTFHLPAASSQDEFVIVVWVQAYLKFSRHSTRIR